MQSRFKVRFGQLCFKAFLLSDFRDFSSLTTQRFPVLDPGRAVFGPIFCCLANYLIEESDDRSQKQSGDQTLDCTEELRKKTEYVSEECDSQEHCHKTDSHRSSTGDFAKSLDGRIILREYHVQIESEFHLNSKSGLVIRSLIILSRESLSIVT